MLKLKKEVVDSIKSVTDVSQLHSYLQNAIELEHATIPVYLTGLFSIKQTSNSEASKIIRSVVIEEMLHMSIACNVLNALGGSPAINKPDFVPSYPGPLPMNVGEDRQLVASLEPLSKQQIKNVYMAIEEPENPLEFPVENFAAVSEQYSTIGEFYAAIIEKIKELGEPAFTGDPSRQLVNSQWFAETELWAVTDVNTACKALNLIVEQGEGTQQSPLDPEKKLAHYYRFAEVFYGKRLVPDTSSALGWSYNGEAIPLDESQIYKLQPNAKAEDYPAGSVARRFADQSNYTYSSLLNNLHQTFNGHPDKLNEAMGLMYELRLTVQKMVTIDVGDSYCAAPPFQYVKTNT
ncbi:Ferritin-like [Alteromonadaceae bacterium Bs31]|nr:Ferritin-like [Alteromonadaceae bacterium Bs31]